MKLKQALTVILCVLLSFSFASCTITNHSQESTSTKPESTTEFKTDDKSFILSYTQSDSLNPFEAETLNNQTLATLVFDSLFILDENFSAQNDIAASHKYSSNTTLSVNIKQKTFSNGDNLTADDVVYSFNLAKDSPAYSNSLKAISYAYADSKDTVVFSLSYPNPFAHNLLTFPIALYASCSSEYEFPVGSGRYKFEKQDSKIVLKACGKDGFKPRITTINLINVVSDESIDNAINIGNINFAFRDLSNGAATKMTCQTKAVQMNNLVYIGLNYSSQSITCNKFIRRAISLAVDRGVIAKSAYQNYASASTSVYNPVFELAPNTRIFEESANTLAAKQSIAQSGYEPEQLKLRLVVNKNANRTAAAKLIKSQLEAAGFKVDYKEYSYKEYKQALKDLSFDIYVGETKLSNDMNFYTFFKEGGSTSYGIDNENSICAQSYKKYLSGELQLGDFILAFNDEMPFIPIVYRKGMICYSKAMYGDMQGTYSNCFSNIQDWYF